VEGVAPEERRSCKRVPSDGRQAPVARAGDKQRVPSFSEKCRATPSRKKRTIETEEIVSIRERGATLGENRVYLYSEKG